ncbi:MAG: MtaA/CmuA family methyltransferase [Candidatus Methanomethylicus sp.]|nr:MtaA/CmuA family methyltransferase [Candidatus Methanomethylicus sp.]
MTELSQKKRLLNAIAMKTVDRVPVVSMTQTGTVELMNASNAYWPKAHKEVKSMAELAVAGHSIAGLEAVRLPFGLTSEAATMGCEVDYHEDKIDYTPNVKKGLDSYDHFRIPEPTEGMMGQILEASKFCRKMVGEDVPIIVGVTGPFTIAGHIRGVDAIMRDLMLSPSTIRKIEEATWQVVANFTNALAANGVDVVAFIEPNASIIGPVYFKTFVSPYMKKITDSVKVPTILHVCGNSLPIMNLMVETGVNGVSIDQKVSITKAKAVINGRCSIIGNVDPVGVLLNKKANEVMEDCKRIIAEGTDVLAPGCGIAPHTSVKNIKAMVKVGKESYK